MKHQKKHSGSGFMTYLRLSRRYDKAPDGKTSNLQYYSYAGAPDGYPDYADGKLPASYRYATTVYNQDNSKTVFTYSDRHDTISKTTYVNSNVLGKIVYSYDAVNRTPIHTQTETYNASGFGGKNVMKFTENQNSDAGLMQKII